MKKIVLIVTFLCSVFASMAQERNGDRREALLALKVGMITEKISLSSEQAEQFWPVYNAYSHEKRDLNRSMRREINKSTEANLSDKDRLASQDRILKLKQDEIELTKSYRDKLLKVISTKQYAELQAAEENFNRMLLQELRNRKERSNN